MLEHVPHWLGATLRNVRAGHAKLMIVHPDLAIDAATLDISSPAFANGARLPERFTADGDGVSPPLSWSGLPPGTAALVLVVEDPDAPAPNPLVHAILWGIPPEFTHIDEGAITDAGDGGLPGAEVGRNSFLRSGWLPPDPPTGHGPHDYVFQLFALRQDVEIAHNPGRSEILEAMKANLLGAGFLVGTYSRGETAAAFSAPVPDGPLAPA